MKNLNVIAAILLVIFFALTSCQKENMADLPQASIATEMNTERNLPAGGIHIVNELVQTEATARVINEKASSRSRTVTGIECGTVYDGCTQNQGNSLTANQYPSCIRELGATFSGEDQIFYLVVPSTPEAIMTYDISLTGMSQDLDLFLLALDANGRISECKAISINGYDEDEHITVTGLNPGAYVVMVDAYKAGITSHFQLAINCSAVSANPPSVSSMDQVSRITTTQTSFNNLSGYWFDEMEPPHFATPYAEVARTESSITIERKVVVQNTETTTSVQFDLATNQATITETTKVSSSNGTTLASSIRLDQIVNVEYNEDQAAVGYSSIEFAEIGGTAGIGAFVQETDSKWLEYAFASNAEHHFVETSRNATSIILRDNGRGVTIRLDFSTYKVVYSDDAGTSFDLYDIIDMD